MTNEMIIFDYENAKLCVEDLREKFPFAEYAVQGRTWCSRAVLSLALGSGNESVLFAGGLGGNGLSSVVLFRFFERLCAAYKNDLKISAIKARNALREKRIVVLPLINPDGTEILNYGEEGAGCYRGLAVRASHGDFSAWRANARGVDLSENFNFNFSDAGKNTYPSPAEYRGPSAESEPETKAVCGLCERENFKHIMLLTSPGEKIFYNSFSKKSDTAMMAQIFKSVCDFGIGKKAAEEKAGGMCEWFTEKHKKPSFEIALGCGDTARDAERLGEIYGQIEEMLMLSAIM